MSTIFNKIINREISADIIYETDERTAVMCLKEIRAELVPETRGGRVEVNINNNTQVNHITIKGKTTEEISKSLIEGLRG